jgi:polysaccharide biosynthesis protein PslG
MRNRQSWPRRPIIGWAAISVLLIVMLSLAAGCGGKADPTPTPTKTPRVATSTSTPVPPTDTPAPPTEAPTDTPAPATDTVAPTATLEAPTEAPPTHTPAPATLAPTNTPAAAPSGSGVRRLNSPEYGMHAFLWWRPEVADRDLQLIKEAGFGWVKQTFAWREIEGAAKGSFDWERPDRIIDQVQQYGLNIIVRLDSQPQWAGGKFPESGPPDNMQDFADFVSAVATRYKGRVDAYQIWNEPNLNVEGRSEWGGRPPNPAEYTEMLKMAYQAIKAADPEALVVSAGLAPTTRWDDVAMPDLEFLRGMYAAGAKPYFDLLGAHGAGFKVPPETDPAVVAADPALNNNDPSTEEMKRIYCFRHVEDIRRVMVENGDSDKQVAVLEFGWTTEPRKFSPYRWHAVTDFEQGEYLVRAYQYARENWSPWIGLMSLIYLPNVDWTKDHEETWWSIIGPGYPELKLRPAYVLLKEMPK